MGQLKDEAERQLDFGQIVSANTWAGAVAGGEGGTFHLMNLYKGMVCANVDHATALSVCLKAQFFPSQSETMTQDAMI
jgi:hypothetical protein